MTTRKNRLRALAWIATLLWIPPAAASASFAERPDVHQFVVAMADRHGFDVRELNQLFAKIKPRPGVARTMTEKVIRPAPWARYRAHHVNAWNIRHGVDFWDSHAATLARAQQVYGVPEEVIIAIIGVETHYGKSRLSHPTLDTLATLAFDYPRRADFFRGELEQYLLLMREEGRNPRAAKGSYAGALGIPQFMPSSYRAHAVDFDGDGRRDLWRNASDTIGSVANYLKAYGWAANQPVALRAHLQHETTPALDGLEPSRSLEELLSLGVAPAQPLPPETPVALLAVETNGERELWLGLHNFYVITRYNHSLFYALAVHQLGNEIRLARALRNEKTLPPKVMTASRL